MPFSVFVSYRRGTAAAAAGRLYDALTVRLGDTEVFMDVDGIEAGADFEEVLTKTLDQCRALVVVIDPQWATVRDAEGRLRLQEPGDFVRLEVERALQRGVRVFPVLVDGARMPGKNDLPGSLSPLASRQAIEITSSRFRFDVGRLLAALEPLVASGRVEEAADTAHPRPRWIRRPLTWIIAVVAIAAVVVAAFVVPTLLRSTPPSAGSAWTDLPDMPVELEGAGVAAFDGLIWVAGGVSGDDGRDLLDTVSTFDPDTSEWDERTPLPQPLAFASLVATKNDLYLIGGQAAAGAVAAVIRWDAASESWAEAAALPEPRLAGAAAWDGTRIVYAGGVGTDHTASDAVFALGENGWESVGVLQIAREKASAVTDGFGTVWVIGGRDTASGIPAFGAVDVIKIDRIIAGAAIAPVHSSSGAWFAGSGACVIGGDTPEGITASVDCLASEDPIPPLPSARAGLGAATLGGTVYALGGYSQGDHGSATALAMDLDAGAGE